MEAGRTLAVGLLWHSATSDNFGVGALTVSQIAILRAAAADAGLRLQFRILGWRDPRPAYVADPDVENAPLRTRDLLPFAAFGKAARECDLILDIGAGDSFADIYGASRFAKMMAAKLHVIAARRPLVLSPQTLGPFDRPWARGLARFAMGRARAVFARDALSRDYARDIGFKGEVLEATDVALRLPYVPPRRQADGKIRFGLNVSGLLFNGGYTGANQFGLAADYPTLMREVLAEFTARPGCEVHLVSHVISDLHPVEDDHSAAETLARDFPGATVAPRFANPSEAKGYIAGMDLFAGARMHACIAAFSAGVPVVPMAYSRKFAGLFGSLGYDRTVDCRSDDEWTILAALSDAYDDLETLQAEVRTALAEGLRRLDDYQAALTGILAEVAAERARIEA